MWFAAGAAALVWAVFQSPMLDYRLVMLGAVLPVAEIPFGAGPLHTLAVATAVMVVVMLGTTPRAVPNRRLWRRRLLGLPIGMFLHLVLDGAWTRPSLFWWPASGWTLPQGQAPELARGVWSVALEAAGVLLGMWLYSRWGLEDPERRRRFRRTGQLDRAVASRGEG